jgi:Dimerisation domain
MDVVSTAHVLDAAVQLGLIDQLTSGPRDINELAHACATDPSMTALLLDALAGLGLARRDAVGRYALASDALPLLRTLIRSWSQLSDVVRTASPWCWRTPPWAHLIFIPIACRCCRRRDLVS